MKPEIFVELPSQDGAPLKIARVRNGVLELQAASAFKANGQVQAVAFAPALSVARFRVAITARSESEAEKAALYAIEDDLAQPVEDAHLTLAPKKGADATRDVYVVDQSVLNGWNRQLQAAGLGRALIVPENSLPAPPGTILDYGDRLLLMSGQTALGIDTSWPEEAISALINAAGLEGVRTSRVNALESLAQLYARGPGISLNRSDSSYGGGQGGFRSWIVSGVLAVAALAIWTASIWAEASSLAGVAARNEQTARDIYRAQFAGLPDPIDIHAEVRSLSQQLAPGQSSGFRPLSSALYDAMAGSETVRLAGMSYDGGTGTLEARLQFANPDDDSVLRARLEAKGLGVETVSTSSLPSGLETTLIVRPAP